MNTFQDDNFVRCVGWMNYLKVRHGRRYVVTLQSLVKTEHSLRNISINVQDGLIMVDQR